MIEKIRRFTWSFIKPRLLGEALVNRLGSTPTASASTVEANAEPASLLRSADRGNPVMQLIQTASGPVAMYHFGAPGVASAGNTPGAERTRILVLKLDHLGDFVIGLPSLQRLREVFPTAQIRLVVGSWNCAAAVACGLANEVTTYDFFPQNAQGWDGKPNEPVEKFRALTTGRYDIAIDLRVDEDTRFLLGEVDARMRCGIGLAALKPVLDIALPPEHATRNNQHALEASDQAIGPARFQSRMPIRFAGYHETDFRPVRGHIVYGPYIMLPAGHFTVNFDLQLSGLKLGLVWTALTLDVARDCEIISSKRLSGGRLRTLGSEGVTLTFENANGLGRHEFRIRISGRPCWTRLRFAGVRLDHAEAVGQARFRPAYLHTGEQLSLLVQLVADRTRVLYPPQASRAAAGPPRITPSDASLHIAIAPFSNSDLRDWPFLHYVALVRLLIERLDCTITLLGSPTQAEALERLARTAGSGERIRNLGGRTAWSDMPALLRAADLVICNNSSIAHLAAACGARTLAIYSGSHQPTEWGPRGQHSHALMTVVPCSPCGYDRLNDCPHQHRCMQRLAPETVFVQARALLLPATDGAEAPGSVPLRVNEVDTDQPR